MVVMKGTGCDDTHEKWFEYENCLGILEAVCFVLKYTLPSISLPQLLIPWPT